MQKMSWGSFLRELAKMTSVTVIDRFLNDDSTPVTVIKPKVVSKGRRSKKEPDPRRPLEPDDTRI